jgi:hypothetical protein
MAFGPTEQSLRWAGGTSPVDVSQVRLLAQLPLLDVQATDRVAVALVADSQWSKLPILHRVPGDVRRLYDKRQQMLDAAAAGVPTPNTVDDPDLLGGDTVVVKQRIGSGGDAVVVVSAAEVGVWQERWQNANPGLIYQDFFPGEYTIVGGYAVGGVITAAACYRASQAPGDPRGPSATAVIIDRPDMIEATGRYLELLEYSGPFCLDFLVSEDEFKFIDFNPRFFGAWSALELAGVPIMDAYLADLQRADRHIEPGGLAPAIDDLPRPSYPLPGEDLGSTVRGVSSTLRSLYPLVGIRGEIGAIPSTARAFREALRK